MLSFLIKKIREKDFFNINFIEYVDNYPPLFPAKVTP